MVEGESLKENAIEKIEQLTKEQVSMLLIFTEALDSDRDLETKNKERKDEE